MLASLLTQLLGKVAEAKLMHAKAYNLPMFYNQMLASYVVNLLQQKYQQVMW